MIRKGDPKNKNCSGVQKIDNFLKFSFWITLPNVLVTSFRICYTIPSIYSDSSIVRYATNLDNGYLTNDVKALDFKTEIQWRITWDFLSSDLLVMGLYPFFLVLLLGGFWVFICGKFNIKTSISKDTIFKIVKNTINGIGILGVLVTAFSIWGFK